ncbi:hypothetical protein ACIP8G_00160 [Serratia liquefaciens]|uniref:hypothetical protein n=1 Tax=Serratia liquefaciens TaxID=614 RepID=UPI003813983E
MISSLKTPSNATENISYGKTDDAVGSVTPDGQLIAAGEGTVTISVTGDVSGKSISRVAKVTAALVVSDFLAIKKNLSEIADAGKKAQEESRRNLGLGKLATQDAITAKDAGAVPFADKTLPAGRI